MRKCFLIYSVKFFIITSISAIFFSCNEDILEEKPLDFIAPENAYVTESGILQGIAGINTEIREAFYNCNRLETKLEWRSLGTDLAYMGEDPGTNRYLVDYVTYVTPASPMVEEVWDTGFRTIQWANLLIENIMKADENIFITENRNVYLAEARFFRAFAYRNLVSTFGDIPLLTEPTSEARTDFTRDPVADIHKLMEEDFKFGTTNLPEPGEEAAPGRITQGAAWHYLGETYLEMGENKLAVEALTQVVNGYNYALMTERFGTRLENDIFGSGDPFYDLFGYNNQNLPENTEAIWVVQIEPFIVGGSFNREAQSFGPAYFRMGNTPDGYQAFLGTIFEGRHTGYSDTLSRPTAHVRSTNYVNYYIWQSDWDNDIRNAPHNIKRDFFFDNPASAYHEKLIDFDLYEPGTRDAFRDTNQYIYPLFTKFIDPLNYFTEPHRAGGGKTHKDFYAIRFAETLLLRAEGYYNLGMLDLAASDINKIRNRANATPVSSDDVDLDYILDEYARELYGRHWRHILLRRMDKLVERTRKYNSNPIYPGARIEEHNKLWPIPQKQIDLNVDAEFPQNPGY